MAELFGREHSREELLQRTGNADQFGGVRLSRLAEGGAHGLLVADFRTGSGLSFTVSPDRGMDILHGEFRGVPLCWRSYTGDLGPALYEPEGLGWLRTFCGGILATCGFTAVGSPSEDEGESLGLHGRANTIAATNVHADSRWDDDELHLWVQGKVREARVFGPSILLTRRVSTRLGESRLWIRDSITNEGHTTQPHMILYHFNMGYPLVSEASELLAPSREVMPRDEDAEAALDRSHLFDPPTEGQREQVYYHDMGADEQGFVVVALVNRELGLGVYLRYRRDQLPRFVQWRMCGMGHYVCGMEPANCRVAGRDEARRKGELEFIEPGETRDYELEFGVVATDGEIRDVEERVAEMRG